MKRKQLNKTKELNYNDGEKFEVDMEIWTLRGSVSHWEYQH